MRADNQSLLSNLQSLVTDAIQVKRDVVQEDPFEHGIRATLNLGHTFGHAIEAEQGYGNWLHGEAVGAGMVMAAKTALLEGLINQAEYDRIVALIKAAELPVDPPKEMGFDVFMDHMMRDKKVQQGKLRLVLPEGIGRAGIFSSVAETLWVTLAEAIIFRISLRQVEADSSGPLIVMEWPER